MVKSVKYQTHSTPTKAIRKNQEYINARRRKIFFLARKKSKVKWWQTKRLEFGENRTKNKNGMNGAEKNTWIMLCSVCDSLFLRAFFFNTLIIIITVQWYCIFVFFFGLSVNFSQVSLHLTNTSLSLTFTIRIGTVIDIWDSVICSLLLWHKPVKPFRVSELIFGNAVTMPNDGDGNDKSMNYTYIDRLIFCSKMYIFSVIVDDVKEVWSVMKSRMKNGQGNYIKWSRFVAFCSLIEMHNRKHLQWTFYIILIVGM